MELVANRKENEAGVESCIDSRLNLISFSTSPAIQLDQGRQSGFTKSSGCVDRSMFITGKKHAFP